MLFKIAFRNVRRQIGGYLIYFFTVALTVALLFSLAGIMFSRTVFDYSTVFKIETVTVCVFLAIVLTIVSALVLGYGCAFLLRRRKQEFGMYLTLGMTRGNIVTIFALEMLFIFLFSLAAGLGLGTLVYQAIVAGISSFLEIQFAWADYTSGAFILTIVLVGTVFLITTAIAASYLHFEKIANLLKGEKSKGKQVKSPRSWLYVALVFFAIFIVSVIVVAATASGDPGGSAYVFTIVIGAAIVFISIIFTYVGALKSGTHYLLQNKKFSGKGTRTFTLRQLSDRVSADSVFFGVVAVLLSIVIVGGNIFMSAFGSQVAQSEIDNPYSVGIASPYDKTGALTKDVSGWLEDFGDVKELRSFDLFEVEEPSFEQYLLGSAWLLRESDYYALAEMADEKAGDLNDGALLVCNRITYKDLEEKKRDAQELIGNLKWETDAFTIVFNGVSPTHKTLVVNGPSYMLAVPDNVVDAIEQAEIYSYARTFWAVNYAGENFDGETIEDFFWNKNDEDAYKNFEQEYNNTTFFRVNISGSFLPTLREMATPWLMIVLFVTLAFALLSMAVVALKSLAAVAEDKRRYRLLYLAGASKRQTFGSLCAQIAIYFFLPFAAPILICVPAIFIAIAINDMMGGALTNLQVIGYAAIFLGVLLLFYALYCTITCLVARADVKRELRS